MPNLLSQYAMYSSRRYRLAAQAHTRLDIQGLRMVAVLTVFANHLWGQPGGGFIGVDVFFVISGFLITGNLLRMAETAGNVSFRTFYWNRVRRIVPAATIVLILTYLASLLVFQAFRSQQVGIDALFAFFFMANWHFAVQDTDYFEQDGAVSPVQHYWSLSIEEQFYFVWPALIFAIGLVVLRNARGHARRVRIAGTIMALVVTASFGWAVFQTVTEPAWAYFDTFARIWELGVGALLATAVGALSRIPDAVRPILSWLGLSLIAISVLLIHEGSTSFPAPWALIPVAGAALVVAAGVGGEPRYQPFLRNPVSTYIGDISYSLYLVHWPIIVLLSAVMDAGPAYYFMVVALAFGLAIASYHLVENPLRRAGLGKLRHAATDIIRRRYEPLPASKYAAVASLALVTVAVVAFTLAPKNTPAPGTISAASQPLAAREQLGPPLPEVGPLGLQLRAEIATALEATEWPVLNPTMEAVITDRSVNPEISSCGDPEFPDPARCVIGDANAPVRILLTGDSIATAYSGPLQEIVAKSNGKVQLNIQSMDGCQFTDAAMRGGDQEKNDACPARKQHTVEVINTIKPTVVVISNQYTQKFVQGSDGKMSPNDWAASMEVIVRKFAASTQKVVFLAPAPADAVISECYTRTSVPADCVSRVTSEWADYANAEYNLAQRIGGEWVDSRPWLCDEGLCPSFVGSTPTKWDARHLTNAYGQRIAPVVEESMRMAGVLPADS